MRYSPSVRIPAPHTNMTAITRTTAVLMTNTASTVMITSIAKKVAVIIFSRNF